jgi:hypothetical protein
LKIHHAVARQKVERRPGLVVELKLSTPEQKCISWPEQKYISDAGKKAPELGPFPSGIKPL